MNNIENPTKNISINEIGKTEKNPLEWLKSPKIYWMEQMKIKENIPIKIPVLPLNDKL